MTATYVVGDTRAVIDALPDGCVDLVVTSVPFYRQREYLPGDHPDKALELGSEPTAAEFVGAMLDYTAGWRRVLAPHGSIAVEIGDKMGGSGGAGGDYGAGGWRDGQPRFGRDPGGEVLAKSLYLTPELYRVALAYGVHPLTGEPSPAGRWRVRNIVEWCKPNPTPGDDGDKWRRAHTDIVVACLSAKRWWDDVATRQPANPNAHARTTKGVDVRPNTTAKAGVADNRDTLGIQHSSESAPLLDWWVVNKGNYSGAHYATWPTEIPERMIQAMCPRRVCRTCGTPSRREVGGITLNSYRSSERTQTVRAVQLADEAGLTEEHIAAVRAFGTSDAGKAKVTNAGAGHNSDDVKRLASEAKAVLGGYFREFVMAPKDPQTTGWSTCGCPGTDGIRLDGYHTGPGWRRGLVCDPFAGTFTTGVSATGHDRDALGFDIDERNVELARDQLGMFLDVVDLADLPTLFTPEPAA